MTFISVLTIAIPHNHQVIGTAVVQANETRIGQHTKVMTLPSKIQVYNPQAIRFWQRQDMDSRTS